MLRAYPDFCNINCIMKQYRLLSHTKNQLITMNSVSELLAIFALFREKSNNLQKSNSLIGYAMQCAFTS